MKPPGSLDEITRAAVSRGALISTLAMIGSAACWGSATVMSRDLLYHLTSTALLVVQLSASVTVLLVLAAFEWRKTERDKGLFRASLTGILEPGLAYSVGLTGLFYTSASNASVISAAEPIMIVLLAWALFGQRPSARLAVCIAIAISGVILVSWADIQAGGQSNFLGDILIVAATMFAAAYVVLSSKLVRDYPPGTLAASQQGAGLIFALLLYATISWGGWQPQDWSAVSATTLAYAAFSGVVQYAAAFWLYLVGLRYLSAGVAALWLTLVPVFGVLGAMVWLGEKPAMSVFIGGALIVGAISISRAGRETEAA